MKLPRLFVALTLLAAAPGFAATTHWHSVAPSSSIKWIANWQGNAVKGGFSRFTISARQLNPEQPAGAQLAMQLDTTSIKAASPDVTEALHGAEWFDTSQHPNAVFDGRITGQGNKLRIKGQLRLKHHTRPLDFPVNISRHGKTLLLRGSFAVQRGDFGIGTGQWSSGKTIALGVKVEFSIVMAPGHAN